MEIYSNLHESLQHHVDKMHMAHNVFPELVTSAQQKPQLCLNCAHHGFPCLNCAYFPYQGKLGPGYSEGKRIMVSNDEDDEEVWFEMLMYILLHDPKNLTIVSHLQELHQQI